MRSDRKRVLSVSARTGRIGCVLLEHRRPVFWATSEKASQSAEAATSKLRDWVEEFKPAVLVSENPDTARRKGSAQRGILKAFQAVGEELSLLNLVVRRQRNFQNFYLEIEDLVRRFPELKSTAPKKPPIWKSEPYRLVCYEALALTQDAGLLAKDDSA
jgi:hypothetical protein